MIDKRALQHLSRPAMRPRRERPLQPAFAQVRRRERARLAIDLRVGPRARPRVEALAKRDAAVMLDRNRVERRRLENRVDGSPPPLERAPRDALPPDVRRERDAQPRVDELPPRAPR
eukprot:15453-Pelagococcus_subviridis.AAC.1